MPYSIRPSPFRDDVHYTTPAGAEYNGTDDWQNLSNTFSNGHIGSLSFWFNSTDWDDGGLVYLGESGVAVHTMLTDAASENLFIKVGKTGQTTQYVYTQTDDGLDTYLDGEWHNVLFSWNYDTPSVQVYIDEELMDVGSPVSDTVSSMGTTDFIELGRTTAFSKYTGALSQYWLHTGTAIDFSVKANRRKFISPSKRPVFLGDDGSKPTGSQPEVFLKGTGTGFNVNSGSLGNFTANATFDTPTTKASD